MCGRGSKERGKYTVNRELETVSNADDGVPINSPGTRIGPDELTSQSPLRILFSKYALRYGHFSSENSQGFPRC